MISNYMKNSIQNSSLIRKMFEEGELLKRKLGKENVFDYSLGNPMTEVPSELVDEACRLLKDGMSHGYMDNAGFLDVRENIAETYNKTYDTTISADNIIMCVGAAGGLNITLKTILNRDDEVIVFTPYFSEYKFYIQNNGGKIVECATDENFIPDLYELGNKINEKTKAVIINTPNNPTGVMYDENTIAALSELLNKKSKEFNNVIYLISDEPYREIVYGNKKHISIVNHYNDAIICYSYSKSLSLAGERIGYVTISNKAKYLKDLEVGIKTANRILGFVNAPALFQKVVGKYPYMTSDLKVYSENLDIIINILDEAGFEYIKPDGAFYLLIKCNMNDVDFCNRAKEFGIILVPTSAFKLDGYARLSFCIDTKIIKNSKTAFKKFGESL